jgi:hypothetical protein
MNLQELESISIAPEPSGLVAPLKALPLPVEEERKPGKMFVSSIYDSKGHLIERFEEPDGGVSLLVTSKNPIVTQEEINEVEAWYWSFVGVRGKELGV